jgi:hypothetical protein
MEVPMLDEKEYAIAKELYSRGMCNVKAKARIERFKFLLDYYNGLSEFGETEPNAILHHRIAQFGPACENCGKPYRTPKATLCAACGNSKVS